MTWIKSVLDKREKSVIIIKESEVKMAIMTDKQLQFIAWLITTATDKCQTIEEVKAMNAEIRKHSLGIKEESEEEK